MWYQENICLLRVKKRIDVINMLVTSKHIWHPSPQNIMSENGFIYIPMDASTIKWATCDPCLVCSANNSISCINFEFVKRKIIDISRKY